MLRNLILNAINVGSFEMLAVKKMEESSIVSGCDTCPWVVCSAPDARSTTKKSPYVPADATSSQEWGLTPGVQEFNIY